MLAAWTFAAVALAPIPAQSRTDWSVVLPHRTAAEVVEHLRDDAIPYNAHHARVELLRRLRAGGVPRWEAERALVEALASDDYQQRQLAAKFLVRFLEGIEEQGGWVRWPREDREALSAVLVEALQNDEGGGPSGEVLAYIGQGNAGTAVGFLLDHHETAAPFLAEALDSADPQQRLLAGYVLGKTGHREWVDRIAPALIPHLRSNRVERDALFAIRGLYGLGIEVLPHLDRARYGADLQQRQAIELLVLDFAQPPRTRAELLDRWRMHSLTDRAYDPAVQDIWLPICR